MALEVSAAGGYLDEWYNEPICHECNEPFDIRKFRQLIEEHEVQRINAAWEVHLLASPTCPHILKSLSTGSVQRITGMCYLQ